MYSEISSKSCLLAIRSPAQSLESCEQLPYPSEQPRISRTRQRDKSKIPPLISTYKYFLPQYSSSILPFSISNLVFSGGNLDGELQNSKELSGSKTFKPKLFKPPVSPSPRKKWPSTSSYPRFIHFHLLFFLTIVLHILTSSYTQHFLSFSSVFFISKFSN